MPFLPEWAPHIHPLLVHFPIALLFAAVLVDGIGLLMKKQPAWRFSATLLFVLGAVGALAAFFTGRDAADAVMLPAAANTVLTEHADWALWTVWFFGIYALVRLAAFRFFKENATLAVRGGLFAIGLAGLFLVYETGDHGAEMVFAHGVGVEAVEQAAAAPPPMPTNPASSDAAGPVAREGESGGGGWTWTPTHPAAWKAEVQWLDGDPATLAGALVEGAGGRLALALDPGTQPAFFTLGGPLGSLQADFSADLGGFDGTFTLAHHVIDAQNYHFVEIGGGAMREGRMVDGVAEGMDTQPFAPEGWQTFRVVADKTHFRAYAGGKMVTHGHGPAPSPGPLGLRLEGTGTVRLGYVEVTALR